jgi:hypothetical protein
MAGNPWVASGLVPRQWVARCVAATPTIEFRLSLAAVTTSKTHQAAAPLRGFPKSAMHACPEFVQYNHPGRDSRPIRKTGLESPTFLKCR